MARYRLEMNDIQIRTHDGIVGLFVYLGDERHEIQFTPATADALSVTLPHHADQARREQGRPTPLGDIR